MWPSFLFMCTGPLLQTWKGYTGAEPQRTLYQLKCVVAATAYFIFCRFHFPRGDHVVVTLSDCSSPEPSIAQKPYSRKPSILPSVQACRTGHFHKVVFSPTWMYMSDCSSAIYKTPEQRHLNALYNKVEASLLQLPSS